MLAEIQEKVANGQRLSAEQGLYLYQDAPFEELARMANAVRD